MNLTDEIYKKYKNIGVFEADVIYIYADLRGFLIFLNQFPNKNKFLESFVKPLLDKNLTIIIPTFSYTTSGIFNTKSTTTNLGALNKWVLNNPKSERSEHPLFSYSAIGPKAKELVKDIGKSAVLCNQVSTSIK